LVSNNFTSKFITVLYEIFHTASVCGHRIGKLDKFCYCSILFSNCSFYYFHHFWLPSVASSVGLRFRFQLWKSHHFVRWHHPTGSAPSTVDADILEVSSITPWSKCCSWNATSFQRFSSQIVKCFFQHSSVGQDN
jgi:hypothetical protein